MIDKTLETCSQPSQVSPALRKQRKPIKHNTVTRKFRDNETDPKCKQFRGWPAARGIGKSKKRQQAQILSLTGRRSCRCERDRVGRSMNKSVRLGASTQIGTRICSRISVARARLLEIPVEMQNQPRRRYFLEESLSLGKVQKDPGNEGENECETGGYCWKIEWKYSNRRARETFPLGLKVTFDEISKRVIRYPRYQTIFISMFAKYDLQVGSLEFTLGLS